MSHLYVCLFSNGHLKVGRSVNVLIPLKSGLVLGVFLLDGKGRFRPGAAASDSATEPERVA